MWNDLANKAKKKIGRQSVWLGGKYATALKKSTFDIIFPWPPVGTWDMSDNLSPYGHGCAAGLFCGLHQGLQLESL